MKRDARMRTGRGSWLAHFFPRMFSRRAQCSSLGMGPSMSRLVTRHHRKQIVQFFEQVLESHSLIVVTVRSRAKNSAQQQFTLSEGIVYGSAQCLSHSRSSFQASNRPGE
jgi:hypothetical protein